MSCGRVFNTKAARGNTTTTATAAATVAVAGKPQARIPAISSGVPVIPPMLAPSMAVDMARPWNCSNHGASVLPTVFVDRQAMPTPSVRKAA